jgi:hypothetical protein
MPVAGVRISMPCLCQSSFVNRAGTRGIASWRHRSGRGSCLCGKRPLNSIHDRGDAPAIERPGRQAGVTVTRPRNAAHRIERSFSSGTPHPIGARFRNRGPSQRRASIRRVGDHQHIGCQHRGSRPFGFWRCPRGECIEHCLYRPYLRPRFGDIAVLMVDVTPPIPACFRVRGEERVRSKVMQSRCEFSGYGGSVLICG